MKKINQMLGKMPSWLNRLIVLIALLGLVGFIVFAVIMGMEGHKLNPCPGHECYFPGSHKIEIVT
jgi:hypothetical protein